MLISLLLLCGCSAAHAQPFLSPQSYHPLYIVSERPTATPEPTPTAEPYEPPVVPMRGAGCIHQMDYTCDELYTSGVETYHDWRPTPLHQCEGVDYLCQWWGINSHNAETGPCEMVVWLNEPEIPAQSNKTPLQAFPIWPDARARADELGIGLATACAALPWLTEWADLHRAEYGDWPRFDAVCVHSYPCTYWEVATNQTVAAVLAARQWGLDHGGDGRVVLHEFGMYPACGDSGAYAFAVSQDMAALGVAHYWWALTRVPQYVLGPYWEYYPWQAYHSDLVTDGQLTAIGQAYRGW